MRQTDRPAAPAPPRDAAISAAPTALDRYRTLRRATESLTRSLTPEDMGAQSMPDASPTKWHLAHVTWFFETFVLEPFEPDFAPFDPAFRVAFNSYYQGVGPQHPRAQRGLLSRPGLQQVLAWRRQVDERMHRLHAAREGDAQWHTLLQLGLNHEQQHQELLLTDIKHALSCNPSLPAYAPRRPLPPAGT